MPDRRLQKVNLADDPGERNKQQVDKILLLNNLRCLRLPLLRLQGLLRPCHRPQWLLLQRLL